MMRVEGLSFSYGAHEVLRNVSFEVAPGKVTTVLGANGSGKTTLFYLMTKNLIPQAGRIQLDGTDIGRLRFKDFARRVALVNQMHRLGADMTVKQLVALGRTPYQGFLQNGTDADERMVSWALEVSATSEYRDEPLSSLSGGQQQLVWVAMALAQDTPLLFLDEPTTYLDVRYQLQILEMVRCLSEEYSKTVVMVLHDINQAVHYSDVLIGLKDGELIATGPAANLLTPELIEDLYGVRLDSIQRGGRTYAWHLERASRRVEEMGAHR
ncbi:MAG: ABC transporter ATP-binding protein [Coriobacteriales bacterium]|jgi:iron complex transport system ATP-binding protein|nr:ABC transporter ATP-binding protein [Coriobacteriales bacterium]